MTFLYWLGYGECIELRIGTLEMECLVCGFVDVGAEGGNRLSAYEGMLGWMVYLAWGHCCIGEGLGVWDRSAKMREPEIARSLFGQGCEGVCGGVGLEVDLHRLRQL